MSATMTTNEPAPARTPGQNAAVLLRDLADHLTAHPHLEPPAVNPTQHPDVSWARHQLHVVSLAERARQELLAWADSLSVTEFVVDRFPSGDVYLNFEARFANSAAALTIQAPYLDRRNLRSGARVQIGDLR